MSQTSSQSPLLPHFERIHLRIEALWGTRDCRDYLNTLLTDTRDGTRTGFPPHIAKELFRLLHEHDLAYPKFSHASDIVVPFICSRRAPAVAQPGFNMLKVIRFVALLLVAVVAVKRYVL